MYLLLDPSEHDRIRLSLFDDSKVIWKEKAGDPRDLLGSIDSFFLEHHLTLKAIKGVVVVMGEGRFTATRVATTIANSFAFVLRIPVVGVLKKNLTAPQDIIVPRVIDTPVGQLLSATYSSEPNIGKKNFERILKFQYTGQYTSILTCVLNCRLLMKFIDRYRENRDNRIERYFRN